MNAPETPRYRTLAALKAAYDRGEIPPEWELVLDNDTTSVWGESDTELFAGGPPSVLLEEALTLLGIPWTDA